MNAPSPSSAQLDSTFSALADPTRRAIVARLAGGEATVLELAAPFDVSLPAISRHLKVLEHAGLIERGRDAQRRPCRLRVEALGEVVQWAEHTRRAWEARFDRLDAYLDQMKAFEQSKAQAAIAQAPPTTSTNPKTKTKTNPKTKENRRDRRTRR